MFPKLAEVIAAIEDLKERGLIRDYAISGAIAQLFWDEAVVTFDLDVLVLLGPVENDLDPLRGIYEWAAERGYESRAEHIIISDFPVQFLPAPDLLSEEAVRNAATVDSGEVPMRVVRPEYLIALWLRPGPASTIRRRERAAKLRESVDLDANLLTDPRRQSATASYPSAGIARTEISRLVARSARLCADRGSSKAAPKQRAALEHHERCQRRDRDCRRDINRSRFNYPGYFNAISLGTTASPVGADSLVFSRNGIRVSTSSPQRTSHQYSPSLGSFTTKSIRRCTPLSSPLNSTGHFLISPSFVSSGLRSLIPTSKLPATSPDFSAINAVRLMAGSIPDGKGSGGMSRKYVSTIRMTLATLSGSMSTFSQTHATLTSGLALFGFARDGMLRIVP
jgi:hypothetical protein